MKLTQARLKELLHYNPETGVFTRLKTRGGAKNGQATGSINKVGYVIIGIDYKRYNASRLAFLYMEGYFPENDVDHRNRIRHDNRWKNLRHASRQCNSRNCSLLKRNTSGITGVWWDARRQKWCAEIMIMPKKSIYLGRFGSKFDAARARWNAEVKHSFPGCNTTSTAYLYIQKHSIREAA